MRVHGCCMRQGIHPQLDTARLAPSIGASQEPRQRRCNRELGTCRQLADKRSGLRILASKTLGIRFKAPQRAAPASEYHYASVPPMVHRAMITAESVGSYFATEIKKRPDLYPYTKMGDVLPPAPENPDSALLKIDKMTPEQIFAPGTMDPILEAIRTEVTRQAAKLDISTEQNRKAIGSLAFKVTKSKTFIEGQRKSLVAAEKKRLAAIDSEGRRIWDILEGIAAEVRKPLTDWEQIDKDRIIVMRRLWHRYSKLPRFPLGQMRLT